MSVFSVKQYKKEPVTVRMGAEDLQRIDQLAGQFGLSRSEFVNQCIDYALGHMPMPESEPGKRPLD